MKYFAILLCLFLLLSGCATTPDPVPQQTNPTEQITPDCLLPPDPTESVFDTDTITRITFYAYYGSGKGSDVPSDNLTEMVNWLGTFTIGEIASDVVEPGTNTVFVEIEYEDGTIIKQGLDTVTVNGLTYNTKHEKEPECYWDTLSHTGLENDSTAPAPEIGPEGLPTPAL